MVLLAQKDYLINYYIHMFKKETKILKKALIGHGFSPYFVYSLKGDKNLRESVYQRPKVLNFVDENLPNLIEAFKLLLLETGVHRLSIGFNNGEIKTFSIFDPLNMEIHAAENILDKDYVNNNFPKIELEHKYLFIRRLYKYLSTDDVFSILSTDLQYDLVKRNNNMLKLTDVDVLSDILDTLSKLREIDSYYLRTAIISLFNSSIVLSFNCDGTQIMAHGAFKDFVKDIM